MSLPILGLTILFLLVLRWRKVGLLVWAPAWWAAVFVNLRYGMATPIPQSVLWLYMGITAFVLVIYVTSDDRRMAEFVNPLLAIIT
jgi:hypothetical protein